MTIRDTNQAYENIQLEPSNGLSIRIASSRTSLILAVFISAMVYAFALTKGSIVFLVVVQGMTVLWTIYAILTSKHHVRLSLYGMRVLVVLGLILISNILVNVNNYEEADRSLQLAVLHVGGLLAFLFVAQWATIYLNPNHILKYVAWSTAPLVIWILALTFFGGANHRIAPLGIHPNWWGEMAFGLTICILAVEGNVSKILLITSVFLLMYMVQSRGAFLASLVSILVFWGLQYRPFRRPARRQMIYIGFLTIIVTIVITASGLWTTILNFTETKVLLLNDPYRGIGTGLTGRLGGWREAIEIFYNNPVFGQGIDTLDFVHNGFLRWAGEGGLLLLVTMIFLLSISLVRAWRQNNDLVVAALLGVVVYMMTYPRALNLNLVGIILLLSLFPWKMKLKRNYKVVTT